MMKPAWINVRYNENRIRPVADYLDQKGIPTVCESALCPNRWTCYANREMTFMILGEICTRQCGFCGVPKGVPGNTGNHESAAILNTVRWLGADYVVITSVTRDDLPDGGAGQFAETVRILKAAGIQVEVLIPDFNGDEGSIQAVLEAQPAVAGHNMETVQGLYQAVRPLSDYATSLSVLGIIKKSGKNIITKSGFMLGLGETIPQVKELMRDIRDTGCDALTIGQYLKPLPENDDVKTYVHPGVFRMLEEYGYGLGFNVVRASPLVRSSFMAKDMWMEALEKKGPSVGGSGGQGFHKEDIC